MSAAGSSPRRRAQRRHAARPRRPAPARPRLARSGRCPMLTSATRSPCTATPTIAQSMARLVNFWNDQPAAWRLGEADLGQQFTGLQRGLEQAAEELPGPDVAVAGPAAGDQRRVQRQDHRGQVGGGVGVGQRTADRAAVADLRVADLPGGVGEQRQFAGQQAGPGQVVMGGERPDRDVAALVADVGQLAAAGRCPPGPRARPAAASSAGAANARRPGTSRHRRAGPPGPGPLRPTRPACR